MVIRGRSRHRLSAKTGDLTRCPYGQCAVLGEVEFEAGAGPVDLD